MATTDEIVVLRGRRHVVTDCGQCGVVYTVPEVRYDHMRAEGGYAQCPNGHGWGWPKDGCEREKLRRERDLLKQEQARLIEEGRGRQQAPDEACRRRHLPLLQPQLCQHGRAHETAAPGIRRRDWREGRTAQDETACSLSPPLMLLDRRDGG
jgi:hypothetical protein